MKQGNFGAIFNTYGLDPGVIGSIDVYNMSMDFLSGEGENDRRTTKEIVFPYIQIAVGMEGIVLETFYSPRFL